MGMYKEDFVMHLRVKTYLKCLQGFQSKHLAVGVFWSGLSPLAELCLIPSGTLQHCLRQPQANSMPSSNFCEPPCLPF